MSRIADIAQRVLTAQNDLARNQAVDALKAEIRTEVKAKGRPSDEDLKVIEDLKSQLAQMYQTDSADFATAESNLQSAQASLDKANDAAGFGGRAWNAMSSVFGGAKDSPITVAKSEVAAAEEAKEMAAYARTRESLIGERVVIVDAEAHQPEGPLGQRAKKWVKEIDAAIQSVSSNPEKLVETLKAVRADRKSVV
jgi:hypothetical protein